MFTQIILFVKYLGEIFHCCFLCLTFHSGCLLEFSSCSLLGQLYTYTEVCRWVLGCWLVGIAAHARGHWTPQIRSVCATYPHRETASPTREFIFSVSRVREKQRRRRLNELLKVLQTTCDGVGRLYRPGFKTVTNSSHPLLSWEGCRYALAFQPGVVQPTCMGRHALQKAMQCCQGPGGLLAQTLLQGYIEQSFASSSSWRWIQQLMPGLLKCWWWMLKIPLC